MGLENYRGLLIPFPRETTADLRKQQEEKLLNDMARISSLVRSSGYPSIEEQKRSADLSFLPKEGSELTKAQLEKAAKIMRERYMYTCAWQTVMTEEIAKDSVRKYVKKYGVESLKWFLK